MTINIAKDFSRTPGVRYEWQGPYSGERFRDEMLLPLLTDNPGETITVILDGTAGYSTSFLEEAFGGLARAIGTERCLRQVKFVSKEDNFLVEEILDFIKKTSSSPNTQA